MTRASRLLCATVAGFSVVAEPAAEAQRRRPGPPAARELPRAQDLEGPREFRGEDGLRRIYDHILDARFEQADAELERACGPAPVEACHVLAATALWWRIQLDPASLDLDEEFTAAVATAIEAAQAWADRAPDDAEAWFYLGGAYAARVQWRVLRGQKLSAARDGKRIKQALERSIQLDPDLHDAYFGLGMYKYYADIAPAAAKILRFLLLLPGGDKDEGLRDMLRARARGRLLQGEADYQLHIIYLWYERQTPRALELLEGLEHRYPGNPLFLAQIAEIQDVYQHDITASLATWRRLLQAAREHRVNAAGLAEVQARLGIARQLDAVHETDEAIEQLEAVVALNPHAPFGSMSLAHLRLGEAHDRVGAREEALEAYRDALVSAPALASDDVRTEAAERLRRAPDARRAEAYALSLDGWRRFEANDFAGAAAMLERSLTLNGADPVARYRYGRVLFALEREPAALVQLEASIRGARNCPPPILGAAYIEAARLHERAGRRDDAIAYYRTAAALFGGAAETRTAATRALTRLLTTR
jgi:tetratricopeptide (TPR) repeat protein